MNKLLVLMMSFVFIGCNYEMIKNKNIEQFDEKYGIKDIGDIYHIELISESNLYLDSEIKINETKYKTFEFGGINFNDISVSEKAKYSDKIFTINLDILDNFLEYSILGFTNLNNAQEGVMTDSVILGFHENGFKQIKNESIVNLEKDCYIKAISEDKSKILITQFYWYELDKEDDLGKYASFINYIVDVKTGKVIDYIPVEYLAYQYKSLHFSNDLNYYIYEISNVDNNSRDIVLYDLKNNLFFKLDNIIKLSTNEKISAVEFSDQNVNILTVKDNYENELLEIKYTSYLIEYSDEEIILKERELMDFSDHLNENEYPNIKSIYNNNYLIAAEGIKVLGEDLLYYPIYDLLEHTYISYAYSANDGKYIYFRVANNLNNFSTSPLSYLIKDYSYERLQEKNIVYSNTIDNKEIYYPGDYVLNTHTLEVSKIHSGSSSFLTYISSN